MLGGPELEVACGICRSTLEIGPALWKSVLGFRKFAEEMGIVPGKTRGSSLTDGELRILIRWGPEEPTCSACGSVLPAASVPTGGDGALTCTCGASIPTFPVPAWLAEVEPTALQLFGAPRAGSPADSPVSVAEAVRPVLFGCPQCGANLKVTGDSKRVLTCNYCDSDLYLPDALWRTLHPVRKRSAFWVRFSD